MRKILLICLLVQVVLGILASKIYLTEHNTLHANGAWTSTKTQLGRGLMGSFAFVTERQSLDGGVLNLGAWHGFQEIVYRHPVGAIESIELDFRLGAGSYLVVLFDRGAQGDALGARLSAVRRHPSAFLEIASDGAFLAKEVLNEETTEPGVWHHVRLELETGRVTVEIDGRELGSMTRTVPAPPSAERSFGFRGGSQEAVFVDNIEVALRGGEILTEDFDAPTSVSGLALAVSAALVTLTLGAYFLLARWRRGDDRSLGFSFLMVNLTLLVVGGVLCGFFLLRADSYPGLDGALEAAEEAFRRGTEQQVVADIRARHPQRFKGSSLESEAPYRILFLGTSQTWGAGARRNSETFVAVAEKLLNSGSERDRRFECINAGFSSLKAADLVPILERDLLELEPDLMVVNLGTNDRTTPGGFEASVRELAEAAGQAGIRTILVKEANEPGSMDMAQLARFAELDKVGAELGLPVIDMHAHLKRLQDTGFLWWDLVHLTSYGQRLVAEKLVQVLEQLDVSGAEDTR